MSSHKFLLKCPICYKKMWFSGALAHKNEKHPQVLDSDFEKKLSGQLSRVILRSKNLMAKKAMLRPLLSG